MALSPQELASFVAFLKGIRHPGESATRKRLGKLLAENPAVAAEFEVATYPALKFIKKPITFTPILEAVRDFLKNVKKG